MRCLLLKKKILCVPWELSTATTKKSSQTAKSNLNSLNKFTKNYIKYSLLLPWSHMQNLAMLGYNNFRQTAHTGSRQPKAKKCSVWDAVSQVCHKARQPEKEIASDVGLAQMLSETAINSECCYDETMSKGTNKIHWGQPESHVSKAHAHSQHGAAQYVKGRQLFFPFFFFKERLPNKKIAYFRICWTMMPNKFFFIGFTLWKFTY